MAALAEEALPRLSSGEQLAWLAQRERDEDTLRAALGWCVAQGRLGDGEATELGLRLGYALYLFWHLRAHHREAGDWLRQLLALPRAAARTAFRAGALFTAGFFAVIVEWTRACPLLEESLAVARETGSTAVAAAALSWLGSMPRDRAQSRTYLEEALALGQSLAAHDTTYKRLALLQLGWHHIDGGELSLARDFLAQARATSLAVGDRLIASVACDGLGEVARMQGDVAEARQLFEEELALHRTLKDKHGIGHTLRWLGWLAQAEGDLPGAWACYREALSALRDAWDPNRLSVVLHGVASLVLDTGDAARALRLAGAVVAAGTAGEQQSASDESQPWSPNWLALQERAQAMLTAAEAANAWAEGQAMTLEQAIAYALEEPADA
jgi:tetratricopeptide (TPR) repeat protein